MKKIKLLGTLEITENGAQSPLMKSAQGCALVAYLLITKQSHSREHLADLLWDAESTADSLLKLRKLLYRIRPHMPELEISRQHVTIQANHLIDIDLYQLKPALIGDDFTALDQGLALYTNELMSGFYLDKSPIFNEWLTLERENLRLQVWGGYQRLCTAWADQKAWRQGAVVAERWQALDPLDEETMRLQLLFLVADGQTKAALDQAQLFSTRLWNELQVEPEGLHRLVLTHIPSLCETLEAEKSWQKGIELARYWVTIDSVDQDAHAFLMRFLAQSGQITAALSHYEALCQLLSEELGVQPSAKIESLVEKINEEAERANGRADFEISLDRPHIPHNLPAQTTPYFGRASEIEQITDLLAEPQQRFITLVGEGGIGKSRLSLEIGHILKENFRDGVWFIPLAGIPSSSDPEKIERAIATVMCERLFPSFSGQDSPRSELFTRLQSKQLLLIIDNFEHLLDGADLIFNLLEKVAEVKILVSSREPLGFLAEVLFRVHPLPMPEDGQVNDTTSENPAIQLFYDRARRVTGDILPDDEIHLSQIAGLCRLLGGIPLGIELAAAGLRQLTLPELISAIEASYQTLTARFRDIPERHRSMRAVFENSWILLTAAEQKTFAACAVFRGGFDIDDGLVITSGSIDTLENLAEKSLLQQDQAGRYQIHELLRQFAEGKLVVYDPAKTNQKHSQYFLNFLAERAESLHGPRPQDPAADIGRNLDNIRHGWQTAVKNEETDSLLPAIEPLSTYYELRGLFHEAAERFRETAEQLNSEMEGSTLLLLHAHQNRALVRMGDYAKAIELFEKLSPQLELLADPIPKGLLHLSIGEVLYRQGHFSESLIHLNKTLNVGRKHKIEHLIASAQFHRAAAQNYFGEFEEALNSLLEARSIWKELKNKKKLAHTAISLGLVFYTKKQFDEAAQSFQNALILNQDVDDTQTKINILNNLSVVAVEQEEFSKSRSYLSEVLSIAGSIQDTLAVARAYQNLGWGYLIEENVEMARYNLSFSIQKYQQNKNLFGEIGVLKLFGDSYKFETDIQQAIRYYEMALEGCRKIEAKKLEETILISLRDMTLSLKKPKQIKPFPIDSKTTPNIFSLIQLGELNLNPVKYGK